MQEEKYGTRDRAYSAWHRRKSTRRFIGIERAQLLAMIDLDASLYVEYDDGTKEPIALIETAIDTGKQYKCALVTTNLAKRAKLPCFVVFYKLAPEQNPSDKAWKDIESFRVKRLWPKPENDWRTMTPQQWAENLLKMREWSASNIDLEYQQIVGGQLT